MKKILVTGAEGFIGSHLCELLIDNGYSVRALVLYNSFNSWGWLDQSKFLNKIEIILGDIRDDIFIENALKECDIVINLAALIAIPYSYKSPSSYVDTNVKGTLNLLNASLKNKVKLFIQTSTSEVYGSAQTTPIDETHPLNPQSPYAATKVASDKLAMSYYYSFNLPVIIARPFNTFGPRQSLRAVIPSIITQFLSKNKLISIGDTSTTRDFNYVEDTANAFIFLIKNFKKCLGQEINIGSGYEISILDIYNKISKILGLVKALEIKNERIRPKKSEVLRLICDSTKMNKLTKWEPKLSGNDKIDLGLKKTINWYKKKENLNKFKNNLYHL